MMIKHSVARFLWCWFARDIVSPDYVHNYCTRFFFGKYSRTKERSLSQRNMFEFVKEGLRDAIGFVDRVDEYWCLLQQDSRLHTRSDLDRDANQHANITYAAWRADSRGVVAKMAIGSECKYAIASAGIVAARAPQVTQTRDRPRWWLGTHCAPLRSSGHSAAPNVSGSRECCTARRNRSHAQ